MDFQTIFARHPADRDMPARAQRLSMLRRVIDGSFYDVLAYAFHQEQVGQEYIPVAERRPNVTYPFLKSVVEESTSFLFGEGRFPSIDCPDEAIRDLYVAIIQESKLPVAMRDAALKGAVGSVVVQLRVLRQRLHFRALDTMNLTPFFDPEEPDVLIKVIEKYKVQGADLAAQGYDIPDDMMWSKFWFQRIWDTQGEWWYTPWPVERTDTPGARPVRPRIDDSRSVTHKLGFLPMVWIPNLPGGDDIDGACTIQSGIDASIAIDYQLSQNARALRYSSDPTLLIKEPASNGDTFVRSPNNALVVDKDGGAELLELRGTASAAVLDFVKWLREAALEVIHANRSSADRMSAAQSGAALKLHYAPMIQLADALRATYGDGLLSLARMVRQASERVPLRVAGAVIQPIPADAALTLRWPEFFVPTSHDQSLQAATLSQLRDAGLMSREMGVKVLAPVYDTHDVTNEISQIKADEQEADAREAKLAAAQVQVRANSKVP